MALNNGLGGLDEVNTSGAQFPNTQNQFLNGSLTVVNGVNTTSFTASTTIIAGTNVSGVGSVYGGVFSTPKNVLITAGSPFGYGLAIPLTARTNISGGMWVSASGNLAMAAAALAQTPIGVAQPGVNVASGGTVNVIIKGVVAMVSEGTVVIENGCCVGAGAALNTVRPFVAGSSTNYATLASAGSEGVVFVVL